MTILKKKQSLGTLFLALSLLLSFLASVALPFVVKAASAQDSAYTTVPQLILGNDDFYRGETHIGGCSVDMSASWSSLFSLDTQGMQQSYIDSFNTAMENGRWGVSQIFADYNGGSTARASLISVYWTENTSLGLIWSGNSEYSSVSLQTPYHSATFLTSAYNTGGSDCTPVLQGYDLGAMVSQSDQAGDSFTKNFFVYTDHPNYPEGYEGIPIVDSPTILGVIHPDISYVVKDKKVTLLYKQNIGGCIMNWTWAKEGDSNHDIVTQNASEPFIIDVPDYGAYSFLADLQFVGPPAICTPFPEGSTVVPTTLTLEIDGTDFTGGTDEMDCTNQGGYAGCVAPSPYLDCSIFAGTAPYGFGGGEFPDILGGFGCHLTNFMKGLEIFLFSMFVPSSHMLSQNFTSLQDTLDENGGVAGVITAPIVSLQTLSLNTCLPITLALPFVGQNMVLPCMTDFYNDVGGSFFSMYQLIVTGVIGYYVILGILAMIKGFKDPENDKIEALEL